MRFAVLMLLLVCWISSGHSQEVSPKTVVKEQGNSTNAKGGTKQAKAHAQDPVIVLIGANPPNKEQSKGEITQAEKDRA